MIYLLGNSHLNALRCGLLDSVHLEERNLAFVTLGQAKLERSRFSEVRDGRVVFLPGQYTERLTNVSGEDFVDPNHLWGVSMGTQYAPLLRSPFWREAAPSTVALTGERPISLKAVKKIADRNQEHVRAFLADLKAQGVPVFAIFGPWARRDNAIVRSGTRVETVVELDRIARTQMRDWLAEQGIPWVDAPEEARNADGSLREEFSKLRSNTGLADNHHANQDYGRIMLARVMARIDELDIPESLIWREGTGPRVKRGWSEGAARVEQG